MPTLSHFVKVTSKERERFRIVEEAIQMHRVDYPEYNSKFVLEETSRLEECDFFEEF